MIYIIMNIGNCFGEDGIELLRGSLAAKGHEDVLGSLSDDEGLEDEDEEEEEEEEERGDSGEILEQSKEADVSHDSSATETVSGLMVTKQ